MPDRFPFVSVQHAGYEALRPLLPISLHYQELSLSTSGLLDTGSDINVLPYQLGLRLGTVWEERATAVTGLSGNLASYEARGIILRATIGSLAFAWTRAENVPLILGQANFFTEFNVCFYRSQNMFEISRRG